MIRVLIIIAVAGFVLATACFGIAAALGGRDIVKNGWSFNGANWIIDWDDDDAGARWDGPTTTRDVTWAGAESIELDVPADVTFTQAPVAKLAITGPKGAVDSVVVEGGRIRFADGDGFSGVTIGGRHHRHGRRLQIAIAAPNAHAFALNGSQTLSINGFKQDVLMLDIAGSGRVTARGEAKSVDVGLAGSGEIDLTELGVDDAKVDIAGSGETTLGPRQSADIVISGSGDVTLLTSPAKVSTDISGSGAVHRPGDETPAPAVDAEES